MARRPRWDREEILLLLALYFREGEYPPYASFRDLSELLRNRRRDEAADNPSLRSPRAVEAQFGYFLWLGRGEWDRYVPPSFRGAWDEYAGRPQEAVAQAAALLEQGPVVEGWPGIYPVDRQEIAMFVRDLEGLLDDLIDGDALDLSEPDRREFEVAWNALRERDVFERAIGALRTSEDLDPPMEEHGVVGEEGIFKRRRFSRWLAQFRSAGGRTALKRTLRWANLYLGSLEKVIPVLGSVKEMKDALEAGEDDVRASHRSRQR